MKIINFEKIEVNLWPNIVCGLVEFQYKTISQQDFKNYDIDYPSWMLDTCVDKRKAEYLAGRICSQNVFKLIGFSKSIPQLLPLLNQCPNWPEHTIGSISHTKKYALSCVGFKKYFSHIGADIEDLMPQDVAHSVAHQICLDDEIYRFKNEFSFNLLVTLIFSIKETIYKTLYPDVQKFFGFDEITVTQLDLSENLFKVKLNTNLTKYWTQGREISGYINAHAQKKHVTSLCAISNSTQ